jgi:hypothetical protein
MLGQVAAHNPDYANKSWSDVESDMSRGWSADHAKKYGEWSSVSGYASEGFERGRLMLGNAVSGTGKMTGNMYDRAATEAEKRSDDRTG